MSGELICEVKAEKSESEKTMREYSAMLAEAIEKLKESKRSLIIVFEGLDASGKTGCIKRLTRETDIKSCRVIPISKPTEEEYRHHYLYRFWKNLPEYGNCAIFDRSWYGRVLVERIEGFASEDEWRRAYQEINEFEHMLFSDGAIIIKLWLDVSSEEQLRRFKKRMENPAKQHKITEEDWRNRGEREKYDEALADMLKLTDTGYAPWFVIPADDKKAARRSAAAEILKWIDFCC